MESLHAIEDAIRRLHGCEPSFVERVALHETYNGVVIWLSILIGT